MKYKEAHISDGIALTKYLFWLKKNFNKKILQRSVPRKNIKVEKKIKNLNFELSNNFRNGPNEPLFIIKQLKKQMKIKKR